jgi:uncharacterized membrane protein YkgB
MVKWAIVKQRIHDVDLQIIGLLRKSFLPLARVAIFVVYFWFGILKLFELSPATPLAAALTEKTIGLAHFDTAFMLLAIFECLIGLLFLFPSMTRIVIPMIVVHLVVVCSPMVLVPGEAWDRFLVPTLEGQYIIKNLVLAALAIGIAAQETPLAHKKAAH